jgi:ferredoxin
VQDFVNWDLKTGRRQRCWDGCLLENFATVAGNHNFRKDRAARYRHRLYRKGKYVPGKIGGQIACVGCGRCITACTAKIANPVEVYNRLMEDTELG